MAKKTTVPKKTAKLDDKQLDKVQGGVITAKVGRKLSGSFLGAQLK